jgi:hypothetical protein
VFLFCYCEEPPSPVIARSEATKQSHFVLSEGAFVWKRVAPTEIASKKQKALFLAMTVPPIVAGLIMAEKRGSVRLVMMKPEICMKGQKASFLAMTDEGKTQD